MIFENLSDNLHHVSDKFKDFTESSVEYYKLRLFKSAMKGSISLVNLMVFGGIFLFVLFFLSAGLALWLGVVYGSPYIGFLIVGGFYAILFFFIIFFGKGLIERTILVNASKLIFDEDDAAPREVTEEKVDMFTQTDIDEKAENELKDVKV